MSNTLTNLTPVLYSAAQAVSNEPFGIVNSITTSFDDKGVAKGDTVYVPIAPVRSATDFSPGAVTTTGDDSTPTNVAVKITQSKKVSWHLTGEQLRSLQNGGDNAAEMARQWVAQGMRTLRNLCEADAAVQIKAGASRAYGTAGTTPFSSDLTALTNLYKILKDNGAPMADLQCVVNTSAGLNLRNLGIIQQAYQAGSDTERRSGNLLRQFGFALNESAGIATHTIGTGSAYVLNGALAAGAQTVTVKTGTGTVLAGDIITFAADSSNKYVAAGDPSSSLIAAAGSFSLGRPGLKVAVADANAMTIGSAYTPNLAFERSAVVGVYRPPLFNENPTIKQLKISDPSGLTFLLLEIEQYGQTTWEMHLAYGNKVVQQEHVAILIG